MLAGLVQQFAEREADRAGAGRTQGHRPAGADPSLEAIQGRASRLPRRQTVGGPAGEDLRELLDIVLGVSAVHANRVQLEQFARVVLVQATASGACPTGLRASGGRPHRLRVVEIQQHCRMAGRSEDQIGEAAEHVGPDRLAFVAAGQRGHQQLGGGRHAEMIRPERHQPLEEWIFGGDANRDGRAALGQRDADQPAARFAAIVGAVLAGRAKAPDRFPDPFRGGVRWRDDGCGPPLELSPQPFPWVGELAAFADPRAQPEPVQRPQCRIHTRSDGGRDRLG